MFSAIARASQPNVKDAIKGNLKLAMLAKDKPRLNLLKSLLSEITYAEKANADATSDFSQVLHKNVRKRQDSVTQYVSAGRQDLADIEQAEISMIMEYLPKQMTIDELQVVVSEVAKRIGATTLRDKGRMMKELKMMLDPAVAPPAVVSTVVSNILSE